MSVLRGVAFNLGYAIATILWGGLSVLIAWAMTYRRRFEFVIVRWTRFVLWWLRLTCGIRWEVEGREHLPDGPVVALVKHSSTWETLFLQGLIWPQATLIKRELLHIPFFGWAFRLLKPIAIDRRQARVAMTTLIATGQRRLADGISVVLFPEGSRMPPGELGRFHAGGAGLAELTGAPVVVIAHDAWRRWPAHSVRKYPGLIRVRISPPIDTRGRTRKEINDEARRWMAEAMAAIGAPVHEAGGKDLASPKSV